MAEQSASERCQACGRQKRHLDEVDEVLCLSCSVDMANGYRLEEAQKLSVGDQAERLRLKQDRAEAGMPF